MHIIEMALIGLAMLAIYVLLPGYFVVCIYRGVTGKWRSGIREFSDDPEVPGTINVPYTGSDQRIFPKGALGAFVMFLLFLVLRYCELHNPIFHP